MFSISHALEFIAYRTLCWVIGRFSLPRVQRMAKILGRIGFRWIGFRRTTTLENLARAFPELPEKDRGRVAVRAFENVATTLLELLWFRQMTPDDIRRLVKFPNAGLLQAKMKEGSGVLLLTAHIGNWELIPPSLLLVAGINTMALYKPQSNTLIDRDILSLRTKFGTGLVPMGVAVREIFKLLSDGKFILVAADQSAPKESIRMDFFGTEVPVFQGPAVFCLKTRASLIALYVIRQDDGTYEIECAEIPTADLSYSEEAVRELTRRHLAVTEAVIRKYPEQWMWMHRRWKHAGGPDESR